MFKSDQLLQEAGQTNFAMCSITGQVKFVLDYMQTA